MTNKKEEARLRRYGAGCMQALAPLSRQAISPRDMKSE